MPNQNDPFQSAAQAQQFPPVAQAQQPPPVHKPFTPVMPSLEAQVVTGDTHPFMPPDPSGFTGNEYIGAQDLQAPNIVLLQPQSPEAQAGNPNYVQGAQPGMFLLKGVNQLLGTSFDCVPCSVRPRHSVWRLREAGGGLISQYATEAEARERLSEEPAGTAEVTFSHDHLLLVVNPDTGKMEPAMFFMGGSKLRTSRKWNTLITSAHPKRWARIWRISSVFKTNQRGSFYTIEVDSPPGEAIWTPKEVFALAEKLVESTQGLAGFSQPATSKEIPF